jgi:hypothetical protein
MFIKRNNPPIMPSIVLTKFHFARNLYTTSNLICVAYHFSPILGSSTIFFVCDTLAFSKLDRQRIALLPLCVVVHVCVLGASDRWGSLALWCGIFLSCSRVALALFRPSWDHPERPRADMGHPPMLRVWVPADSICLPYHLSDRVAIGAARPTDQLWSVYQLI